MGPKTVKSKSSANVKKKGEKGAESEISLKLKAVLKDYELQCRKLNSKLDVQVKKNLLDCIAESKMLVRFILQGSENDSSNMDKDKDNCNCTVTGSIDTTTISPPLPTNDHVKEELLPLKISPLIKSLRKNWYKDIKELYLWHIEIPREEVTEMSTFFSQACYRIEYLEILECRIDRSSILHLTSCISLNQSMTSLVLDYTNLQMDSLLSLCDGLSTTRSLKKLSLCYCNLSSECGRTLGDLASQTSICELYLDGNFLECSGIISLLLPFVDKAEQESLERKEATQSSSAVGVFSSTTKIDVPKKKKNKKKKKSKSALAKGPPKVGAWLNVLHAANVGIDGMSVSDEDDLLYEVLVLISRWIMLSEDLREIDLDDNLIGELGGREILAALQRRNEEGLKPIFMKITHRINSDVFKQIITLATGKSKRGGKKKKKKKGGPGKRRV